MPDGNQIPTNTGMLDVPRRQQFPIGDEVHGQFVQTNMPLPVKGSMVRVEVDVPGVLAAAQYTANDQVGNMFPIEIGLGVGAAGWIDSVILIETTTQSVAADLFFFDEMVANAIADNSAVSITDALMSDHCLGFVNITNYSATAANSVGVAKQLGFSFVCSDNESRIYGLLVTRGAPTYAVGGLRLKFNILQA